MSIFKIDGYFVDDESSFNGYLVHEYHNVPKGLEDEDIFYYGLSEENIKYAVATAEPVDNEFVITGYEILFD